MGDLSPLLHTATRNSITVLNGREQEVPLARAKVERALDKVINGTATTTSLYGCTVDEQDLNDLLRLMNEAGQA